MEMKIRQNQKCNLVSSSVNSYLNDEKSNIIFLQGFFFKPIQKVVPIHAVNLRMFSLPFNEINMPNALSGTY